VVDHDVLGPCGKRYRTERTGQQRRKRDHDLHGAQVAVGVAHQTGDGGTAAALLGERPHLPLAQRHERDLGRDEQGFDQDQREHDRDVEQSGAH